MVCENILTDIVCSNLGKQTVVNTGSRLAFTSLTTCEGVAERPGQSLIVEPAIFCCQDGLRIGCSTKECIIFGVEILSLVDIGVEVSILGTVICDRDQIGIGACELLSD